MAEDTSSAGVAAKVVIYNATINACETGSQWQCALRLLAEDASSAGVAAKVVIYNATIKARDKSSQWLRLLAGGPSAGVAAKVVT